MGPFFLLGLSGFGVALSWSTRYRSEALILVEQQKVPMQYVTPNVVTDLEERTQQSVSTTEFLEHQLEQARKDLAEQEERLRVYKSSYLGELPQQEQSNLQILHGLEAQLYASSDALGRAEQQKIYLESLRAEYLAMQQSLGATDARSQAPSSTVAAMVLRDLRKQLAEMGA